MPKLIHFFATGKSPFIYLEWSAEKSIPVPEYAKEGPKEKWTKKDKESERSDYYKTLAEKVKSKAQDELNKLRAETITFDEITINKGITVGQYLRDSLKNKLRLGKTESKALMLNGLHNLQSQGFQVDYIQAGYKMKVENNKLSIYKEKEGNTTYLKGLDNDMEIKDLTVFEFSGESEPDSSDI